MVFPFCRSAPRATVRDCCSPGLLPGPYTAFARAVYGLPGPYTASLLPARRHSYEASGGIGVRGRRCRVWGLTGIRGFRHIGEKQPPGLLDNRGECPPRQGTAVRSCGTPRPPPPAAPGTTARRATCPGLCHQEALIEGGCQRLVHHAASSPAAASRLSSARPPRHAIVSSICRHADGRAAGAALADPLDPDRVESVGLADEDHLQLGDVGVDRDEVVAEAGVGDAAGGRVQ